MKPSLKNQKSHIGTVTWGLRALPSPLHDAFHPNINLMVLIGRCHRNPTLDPPRRYLEMVTHATRPNSHSIRREQITNFKAMDPIPRMVEEVRPDLHDMGRTASHARDFGPECDSRFDGKAKQ